MRLFPFTLTQEAEYNFLRQEGYSGNLNDMIFNYLRDQGFQGSLSDMLYENLGGGVVVPSGPPTVRDSVATASSIANMPTAEVGDTIIVYLAGTSNIVSEPSASDAPVGWQFHASNLVPRAVGGLYSKAYEAGDPATADFTPFGNNPANSCITIAVAMQGVADPDNPIIGSVVESSSGSNTTNHNLNPITSEEGETLLAFATGGWGGNFTYTPPTGFTELADLRSVNSNDAGCVATGAVLEDAPAGVTDVSFTNTTALHYVSMIMRVA